MMLFFMLQTRLLTQKHEAVRVREIGSTFLAVYDGYWKRVVIQNVNGMKVLVG